VTALGDARGVTPEGPVQLFCAACMGDLERGDARTAALYAHAFRFGV
jgi:hypothetical protein